MTPKQRDDLVQSAHGAHAMTEKPPSWPPSWPWPPPPTQKRAEETNAPMPPIEVGDWVHEDGEKEAVIVRETHQAKSLNRGIRRSGVTEIRKKNGIVWRRPGTSAGHGGKARVG